MPFVFDYNQYISGVAIGRTNLLFLGFINLFLIKAPAVAVVSSEKINCAIIRNFVKGLELVSIFLQVV